MVDYGALEAYEPDTAGEDFEANDPSYQDGLLTVAPGFLGFDVHSDVPLCVTTETYTRRPPVETRGWQHVVEVGYSSVSGEIRLAHPLGDDPLPTSPSGAGATTASGFTTPGTGRRTAAPSGNSC
ncbi:hypothetical protein [Microbispora sp. H10836]|uniref:hypothetical protein n=1 Tax=Microbispora sp. H10836 TaxID=2729106 RepID=UPI001472838D|nr:hypothetical protein [Microbispora sp. H10836]